jgi:hypothetical protein
MLSEKAQKYRKIDGNFIKIEQIMQICKLSDFILMDFP